MIMITWALLTLAAIYVVFGVILVSVASPTIGIGPAFLGALVWPWTVIKYIVDWLAEQRTK